jgi:hypothetical protein
LRKQMFIQDLRDGNTPDRVRGFYQALMKERNQPNLASEVIAAGKNSLCGVLLEETCAVQQKGDHSVFFFVSSEKILSDVEKRLPIKLLKIWPSDYWLP